MTSRDSMHHQKYKINNLWITSNAEIFVLQHLVSRRSFLWFWVEHLLNQIKSQSIVFLQLVNSQSHRISFPNAFISLHCPLNRLFICFFIVWGIDVVRVKTSAQSEGEDQTQWENVDLIRVCSLAQPWVPWGRFQPSVPNGRNSME